MSDFRTCIGIDFGKRRIGFATGQTLTKTASQLTTLDNQANQINWADIDKIFNDWQPAIIILGLPVNKDGTDHSLTKIIRSFAQKLEQRYDVPVEFEDERQSSSEAEQTLKQHRNSGTKKRRIKKTDIDQMAATIILQRWLDKQP